jgi:VWFA-related protein
MEMPVKGMLVKYTGCPTEVPENFKYSTVWTGKYTGIAAERCEGSGRHPGVDIPLPEGTSIYAVASGTVVKIQRTGIQGPDQGWGVHLVIKHEIPDAGIVYSCYAHLQSGSIPQEIDLNKSVSKGQLIGKSSNTGNTFPIGRGYHLHFQIDKDKGGTHPYWFDNPDLPTIRDIAEKTDNPIPFIIKYSSPILKIFVAITSIDSSNFPKIKLYTTVEDAGGKPVFDLSSSNFKVYEDGTRELPISVSSVGAGFVGMSVCIIMDTSGSMSGNPIEAAKQAAISFVNNLKTEDKAALIRFRETVHIVQHFTDDKNALVGAIKTLYADGYTALYDALYKGVAMASTQPGIKALVALTDGQDNRSIKTAKEVIDYAKSVKVPVYIIGLGDDINEDVLRLIAKETEGQYYRAPTPAELQKLYESISERLKNLYEVSYTTHNKNRDGTIRSVTAQVIHNEASGQDTVEYTAPGLAGAISGVVLDSETDAPIPSATIVIEHETERLKITDASVNTNEKGEYRVENLSPDFAYRVTVSAMNYHQAVYPSLVKVKSFEITENIDFRLQSIEDYFVAKRTSIQELRDKEAIYVEEENKAERFLILLENKGASVTNQEKEALQRLYLTESFANEAYKDSKRLAQLATDGLGGFVDVGMAVISTCGGVGEALKKIPFVGEFLASPYIAAKNEMVNQIAVKSHIFLYQNYGVTWTLKGDVLLREAIGKGYDKIFIKASDALTKMSFSDAMAEVHKFIEKEFFIGIYEITTANFIDKSVEWAEESPPSFRVGTFPSAENRVNQLLNSMNITNEERIKNAEMLIWAGDTIGTAGAIASGVVLAGGVVLAVLSTKTIVGAPLAAILIPLSTKIAIATNTAAAGMKLGATAGIAIDLWSTIPKYVKEGTAYSFDMAPSALEAPSMPVIVKQPPLLFYDTEGRTDISTGLYAPSINSLAPMQQDASDYNFILAEMREHIQNDKPEKVQEILETLIQSGESLLGDVNVSTAQILVASPRAIREIADYDAIYSKFESDLSKAAFARISLYTLLAPYLVNPTDTSTKEILTLQIDKTTDANNELSDTLISTTQVLKNARITIPTLVIIKSFSTPDVTPLQKPFSISAIIKNIGEKRASEVNVKLSIPEDSGLSLMEEEIKNLGSLEPGAEQEIRFQLEFRPRGYTSREGGVNLVTLSVSSDSTTPDFDTLPPTYIFIPTPPPTPPTGGKLSNKNVYAYPNPFNPEMGYVNIRYSLSKDANVTIKIYDISGELVTTLIEEQPKEKGIEYSEPWDGRNDRGDIVANGVYFYLITTTNGEKAVGKIAVLR